MCGEQCCISFRRLQDIEKRLSHPIPALSADLSLPPHIADKMKPGSGTQYGEQVLSCGAALAVGAGRLPGRGLVGGHGMEEVLVLCGVLIVRGTPKCAQARVAHSSAC